MHTMQCTCCDRLGWSWMIVLMTLVTMPALSSNRSALASGISQDNSAAAPGDQPVDQAVALLDQLDRTIVSVDYDGLPLEHVLVDLAQHFPAPLRADWLSLELLGIERETPINLKLDNVPLSTALSGLLLDIGTEFDRPSYEYHEGRIVITTLDATARMRMVATYNIRDLLADAGTVERLERNAPAAKITTQQDQAGSADTDGEVAGVNVSAARSPAVALLDLIADHVDPEAWIEYGGNRAKITEHEGVLLVSAPATLHKKLRNAIQQLRRAIPSNVWLEAAIITIPARAYQSLQRTHHQGTISFARALLRDASSTMVWHNRAASVAIGEQFAATAGDDGLRINVIVTPQLSKDTQMLQLTIDASCQRGDSTAGVKTTARCPGRAAATVVELANTGADEDMQLLVLIPRVG